MTLDSDSNRHRPSSARNSISKPGGSSKRRSTKSADDTDLRKKRNSIMVFKSMMNSTKLFVLVVLCLQNTFFTVLRRYSQGVLRENYSKVRRMCLYNMDALTNSRSDLAISPSEIPCHRPIHFHPIISCTPSHWYKTQSTKFFSLVKLSKCYTPHTKFRHPFRPAKSPFPNSNTSCAVLQKWPYWHLFTVP